MAQLVLDRLTETFRGGEILASGSQHGNEWARVRRDAWVKVATFLRDDPATKMEMFIDLTCVDRFSTEPRFDVVLHVYSVSLKHRVRLYGGVPENDPTIDTLVPVWEGANWFERESYDLTGIIYTGHHDLRRIMLPDDWIGHPLRKDYVEEPDYHGIGTTRASPLEAFCMMDEKRRKAREELGEGLPAPRVSPVKPPEGWVPPKKGGAAADDEAEEAEE